MSEDEARKILAAVNRLRSEAAGHIHRRDTNGDRYRCPVAGCWWGATGAQESTATPDNRQRGGPDDGG